MKAPFSNYFASNRGKVWNEDGEEINITLDSDDYERCSLRNDSGIWETQRIHRLVALNFLPPAKRPDQTTVDHKDKNRRNNYYKNLKWSSRKEQAKGRKAGIPKRIPVRATKISDGSILEFVSMSEAGRKLGALYRLISKCVAGSRKTHAGYMWEMI